MNGFTKATSITVMALLVLGSCTTLSVTTPDNLFLSSGDYVENIKTEGIIQAHVTAWTPFIILFDESKIREDLYKKLIEKVNALVGVDGITNVTFYSKPSVLSILAIPSFGIGIWVDYYAEGVVITYKNKN